MSDERYKANPNPPAVRFIRKNGRIIPIGPKVRSGQAADALNEQIGLMKDAVENAEKGQRVHLGYGTDHEVRGFGSSFPKFYGELGFRNKEDFRTVLVKGKGQRLERLVDRAVADMKGGEDYGLGAKERARTNAVKFQVATRQIFDNAGVKFRTIDDQVRPLRFKKVPITPAKAIVEEPWL